MRVSGAMITLVCLLRASVAHGQTYFPIGGTYAWYFESDQNGSWDITERGDATFNGEKVRKRLNIYDPGDGFAAYYWSYWSTDEFGNVFLHGFEVVGPNTGVYYEPPILWLPHDPAVGQDFSTTFDQYDLRTDEVLEAGVTWQFVVAAAERVEVPFGTFDALRVDRIGPVIAGGYEVDARPARFAAGEEILESHWYAADRGEVQYQTLNDGLFELREFGYILAAGESTWGEMKSRFAP